MRKRVWVAVLVCLGMLAVFFEKHFLFCCLFFQFVYLLGDK